MPEIKSKDGTTIVYDIRGQGPAVLLVDPAFCFRSFGPMPHLAELLSPQFTVYNYDRRGRGESGNTLPYSLEREVEDIQALLDVAGGQAFVYGISSGACLALEAAIALGNQINKLALYEPPYNSDKAFAQEWKKYRQDLSKTIAAGRKGDAVVLFMQLVSTPPEQLEGMRQTPMWSMLETVAPTLEYDAAAIGEDRSPPLKRAGKVNAQTLVMNGTVIPFMLPTAIQLSQAIPHARQLTLEGQSHDVNPDILAQELNKFFST